MTQIRGEKDREIGDLLRRAESFQTLFLHFLTDELLHGQLKIRRVARRGRRDDRSRTDGIASHVEWTEIESEIARHLQHRALRRAVRNELRLADPTADARQLDDRAGALFLQVRNDGLGHQSIATNVDVQDTRPIVGRG